MKRQATLAFQRCLDSLSPLTPHRDEPFMFLTKDREMPSLCIVTGLPGSASTPWKQASCPGGREQQQASCTVNPHPSNPANQTHFIIKLHILKQNSAEPRTKRPWALGTPGGCAATWKREGPRGAVHHDLGQPAPPSSTRRADLRMHPLRSKQCSVFLG